MKCSLVGDKARVLSKFLQFLSKIGPDLFIEALNEGLVLGTTNSSKSGFARIHLCPSYFQNYEVHADEISSGDNCCRVALKACSAIFRSMKNVDTCDIRMNQGADKLIIQLHCRQNTTKTHFISILEQESLSAPSRSADSIVNTLTASQKVFADILTVFSSTEEELTMEATKTRISVKNYLESLHVNRQQMRTQLTLEPNEFDTYNVDVETTLTFCLKEWRAFLVLAESLNANIKIIFETTGLPIEFIMQDLDVFEVTLFMSTLSSELDDSRDLSGFISLGATQPNASTRNNNNKRGHDVNVEGELNGVIKRIKGRTRRARSPESRIQYSNPSIENGSNNECHNMEVSSDGNNRWTVARGVEENNGLEVPTIANGASARTSPRPSPSAAHDYEVIFLRDTEEDSDRTFLDIPMPPIQNHSERTSMEIGQGTTSGSGETEEDDVEVIIVSDSPIMAPPKVTRKPGLSLIRRIFEPSFKLTNATGTNIVTEDSDEEGNRN